MRCAGGRIVCVEIGRRDGLLASAAVVWQLDLLSSYNHENVQQ